MNYRSPKITVDGILIQDEKILLIERKNPPFQHAWALPGGFVEYGETTEDAVVREFLEETGVETTIQRLFGVYSDPTRDPRGHTISVVYVLQYEKGVVCGGDDAAAAAFHPLDNLPKLAFDHDVIVKNFKENKSCFAQNVKR